MKQFKDCPLIYVPLASFFNRDIKNFIRLLEILEIDIERLQPITQQPVQFEKIILPKRAFGVGYTIEYTEMIDRLRHFAEKNKTPTPNEKVYYFYGRAQIGEERLAEYFKSKGYEIIRPEMLTFDEQLNWMINAKSFASTLGSCAHNCLFLRDDTEAIFIPRSAQKFANAYQPIINQVHSLNVNYVDSTLSVFSDGIKQALFCYIISEQLKRFFGDKWDGYEDDDFKTFLEYTKRSAQRNYSINPREKEIYGVVFEDFMTQLKRREDLIAACDMPSGWNLFRPQLSYQTHIGNRGWSEWQNEEQISGSTEDKRDIQAVKLNFPNHNVHYAVYYGEAEGWSEEVSNAQQAGTTGKRKPIHGIKIRLDEAGQKEFDILYRVHKFDDEWTPWAKNNETIYSYGQRLNALQIKLEAKRT